MNFSNDSEIFIKEVQEYAKQLEEKRKNVKVEDNGEPLQDISNLRNTIFSRDFTDQFFVREGVAKKIKKIIDVLAGKNKGLVLLDAWRDPKRQEKMFNTEIVRLKKLYPSITSIEKLKKMARIFVSPAGESPHCTGGAVDVQLYELDSEKVLDFGVDNFRDQLCFSLHPGISDNAKMNRKLLKDVFEAEGFSNYILEYWHFNYGETEWAAYTNQDVAIYGEIFK